jgi:hypothetical protein
LVSLAELLQEGWELHPASKSDFNVKKLKAVGYHRIPVVQNGLNESSLSFVGESSGLS